MGRTAAFEIGQALNSWIDQKRLSLLSEGRSLLEAVITEAEEEIKKRANAIRAEDQKQTEEFGKEFVSEPPLKKLADKLDQLSQARRALVRDILGAANLVTQAIETRV